MGNVFIVVFKMDHANFDELLAKMIKRCRLGESADESSTLRASNLLEIESTIRNIDKELEYCKIRINETLERCETKITNVSEIKKEQMSINFEESNWADFEASLNPRIARFLEIRETFLDLIKKQENSNEKCRENSLELEKLRVQKIHENLLISEEISKVDEKIQVLNSQIRETNNRIDFLQIENAVFRDSLEKEAKKWRQRVDKAEEKLQKNPNRSQKPEFQ